jgi:NAD+ synthase
MYEKKIINYIIKWLRDYLLKSGLDGFVIGLSGGIDSAVVTSLLARTHLPVLIIELPIYKNKAEIKRRKSFIKSLKKQFKNVSNILLYSKNIFYQIVKQINLCSNNYNKHKLLLANIQSRLRMLLLYYYAGVFNYLVTGTGNKIEDFGIGFFTKYGDGGVDINPIADLNKTEVYLLAKHLDIPESIINAIPNDGLWEDFRSDEMQIGLSYSTLEWAMNLIEKKTPPIKKLSNNDIKILNRYLNLHNISEHKMKQIPFCKIPPAFK